MRISTTTRWSSPVQTTLSISPPKWAPSLCIMLRTQRKWYGATNAFAIALPLLNANILILHCGTGGRQSPSAVNQTNNQHCFFSVCCLDRLRRNRCARFFPLPIQKNYSGLPISIRKMRAGIRKREIHVAVIENCGLNAACECFTGLQW